MKRIKTYNELLEGRKKTIIPGVDNDEIFDDLMSKNIYTKTHKLFAFIYIYSFREDDDGRYSKYLDIENIIEINKSTYKSYSMMEMRARIESKQVARIWWLKNATDMIEGKSSNDLDDGILDLIEKHMITGSDSHGRKEYDDTKTKLTKVGQERLKEEERRKQMKKIKNKYKI